MSLKKLEVVKLKEDIGVWYTEKKQLKKQLERTNKKLEAETRLRLDFETKINVLTNENRRIMHNSEHFVQVIKD